MFDIEEVRGRLLSKRPGVPLFVDVDSVVVEILSEWGRRLPGQPNREQFTGWDVHEIFDLPPDVAYAPLSEPDFYEHCKPVQNALVGVRALRFVGFDVVFASSTVTYSYRPKLEWLDRHGFLRSGLSDRKSQGDFIALSRKALLDGNVLIDDSADTFRHWEKIGRQPILFDAPHNQDVDTPYRADWETIIAAVLGRGRQYVGTGIT